MLRSAILALALVAAAGQAAAQDAAETGESGESGVDFILRPTENAAGDAFLDDIWAAQTPPEEPAIVGAIGAPLAGPTANEPIGRRSPARRRRSPCSPCSRGRPTGVRRSDPFAATGMRLGTFILRPAIEIGVSATDNAAGTADKESAVGLVVAPELERPLGGRAARDRRRAARRGDLLRRARSSTSARRRRASRPLRPHRPDVAARRKPAIASSSTVSPIPTRRAARRSGRRCTPSTRRSGSRSASAARRRADRLRRPRDARGRAARRRRHRLARGARQHRIRRCGSARATRRAPRCGPSSRWRSAGAISTRRSTTAAFARSSVWGELRGGLIVDLGEKLSGEVVARLAARGHRGRAAGGPRRPHRRGRDPLVAAAADGGALRLPRPRSQPTSVADVVRARSSIPARSRSARRLSARLRAEAGGGLDYERFVGVDRRRRHLFRLRRASYAFNRIASLEARYIYERTDSTDPAADAEENMVGVRLRLQR